MYNLKKFLRREGADTANNLRNNHKFIQNITCIFGQTWSLRNAVSGISKDPAGKFPAIDGVHRLSSPEDTLTAAFSFAYLQGLYKKVKDE